MGRKIRFSLLMSTMLIAFSGCTNSSLSIQEKAKYYCPSMSDVKIMFNNNFDGGFITNNGDVYVFSKKKYSDETNCKKVNSGDIEIKTFIHLDWNEYVDKNGKIYTINRTDNELENTSRSIRDYGFKNNFDDIVKLDTWLILKKDGIIYHYYPLDDKEEIYKSFDDERILDFVSNLYIKTDQAYYINKITNYEKCNEYADIECEYEMLKDDYLTKNYDKIVGIYGKINAITVIFKNGEMIDYKY